ncbi:MAG: Vitamin B12 dependent methionine synthase activation subunit [Clostridia bacterium]|nr:Vitamin B12 dependent methionine synthase activation subunit [Clostridia bacterium]
MGVVLVREYATPSVARAEVLRYAGVCGDAPGLDRILDACLVEVADRLHCRVCYCEVPVTRYAALLDLGFLQTCSASLAKNLTGCTRAVAFAATLGLELDRLIARYATLSPTKALLLQAIGAATVEAVCDAFARELAEDAAKMGCVLRPRFSPGYGDLPLETQRAFFALLDPPRRIGLTLNESLLMSPTKSVTALIGIGARD